MRFYIVKGNKVMDKDRINEAEEQHCLDKGGVVVGVNAQQQLSTVARDILEKYNGCQRITSEILEDISVRVKGIDGELIDWSSEINELLKFPEGCRPTSEEDVVDVSDLRNYRGAIVECRDKILRLVTLLMLDYECGCYPMVEDSDFMEALDYLLSLDDLILQRWPACFKFFIPRFLVRRLKTNEGRDN